MPDPSPTATINCANSNCQNKSTSSAGIVLPGWGDGEEQEWTIRFPLCDGCRRIYLKWDCAHPVAQAIAPQLVAELDEYAARTGQDRFGAFAELIELGLRHGKG